MKCLVGRLLAALLLVVLSPGALAGFCHPVSSQPQSLSAAEVDQLVRTTAAVAARLTDRDATIAVVDRVGNVLGVWRTGSAFDVRIRSGLVGDRAAGLDNFVLPDGDALAAIAKAVTGAYLSSSGNAFSTRTASFIVQRNFIPTLRNFPSGPLFGVQFSQLPCGDFVAKGEALGVGPRRSPIGLSADPGGFPLYKRGKVVGGIGVMVEGRDYSLDLNPRDTDRDIEEIIAQAGARRFAAPDCIRANRITAGGFNLRYSDGDGFLPAAPSAAAVAAAPGAFTAVTGYAPNAAPRDGTAYGEPGSGYRLQSAASGLGTEFVSRRGMVLTDVLGTSRRTESEPKAGAAAGALSLGEDEVIAILDNALGVANSARAQIRRALNSPAEVTISVVDVDGTILGIVRTPDAPVFGTDVSIQKARTATLFSRPDGLIALEAIQNGAGYAHSARRFFELDGAAPGIGRAMSARAIGNVSRPNFPDGIDGQPRGPFSVPINLWSPFNVGLQLDIVATQVLASAGSDLPSSSCTSDLSGAPIAAGIDNGIQIFPGAVPIYRGSTLVGGIGISGDGVDQDDMIAALGLERARLALSGAGAEDPPGHAPRSRRSDRLPVPGPGTLRYVQCPQSPFVSSQAQNVCNF